MPFDHYDLLILYDGSCPFCDNYVSLQRLRDNIGKVSILNARLEPELVQELKLQGMDINEGMAAYYKNNWYFGAECVHLLSELNRKDKALGNFWRYLFYSRRITKLIYPLMKTGRNLILKLLGVARIRH